MVNNPLEDKWKLDELISMLPSLPLTNWVDKSPIKNFEELTTNVVPSNVNLVPSESPIKTPPVPSA